MLQARRVRRGVAAVELALLIPILAFLLVVAVDWCRIFYCSVTIDNCARNGALWASDPYGTVRSQYSTMKAAALADAPNLSPQPKVSSTSGVDSGNSYVDCTVTYTFTTVTNFPGIQHSTQLVRTVRVYLAPQMPN